MTYPTSFRWASFRKARLSSLFVLGCATFLIGCGSGTSPSAKSIRFDGEQRDLYIQPIQVCNDFGQDCARVNVFAEMTAKILEQARLKVNFLPTKQLHEERFLTINDRSSRYPTISEFSELARSGGKGAYGRHPDSTRDSGPINVWFVDEIESSNGYTQFGLAYVDGNGILISGATLDYNKGKGRADTLAHEIGHNLGLSHSTLGAGGSDNLLTSGSKRNVPRGPDDVYPHGAGLSKLTTAQLNEIVNSPFVKDGASDTTPAQSVADLSTATLSSFHTHEDHEGHEDHFHVHGGHSHVHDNHSHVHDGHSHAHDGHSHAHADHSHVHAADEGYQHPAGLASYAGRAVEDAHKIPEPSTWVAIALVGLSAMLLLKRRTEQATAMVPVPAGDATSWITPAL